MISQNPKRCPSPFGLMGGNNACYFNSLIQALMSCSALYDSLENDSHVSIEYKKIVRNDPRKVGSTRLLLAVINNARQQLQWNISPGVQEDAHEGFILLMELLPKYNHVFNSRYNQTLVCIDCKHRVVVPVESCPTELVIDIPADVDIQKHIRSHVQKLTDYKCDKCKSTDVVQVYQVARLSSIIVLVFKENQQRLRQGLSRIVHNYPEYLSFPSTDGLLRYQITAVIDQFGSLNSGHYTATCIRRGRVYTFDDSSVYNSQFSPSESTYMAFYTLVG